MDSEFRPKVSVIMVAYNQEQYIDEAIRGVILQKVSFPIELIIGDDCSTDSTAERCRRWQEKYPEIIRILPREKNVGLQRNYIDAFNHCRGQYIAICEGDDYWCDRSKLRRQVEYMDANEGCTVCFHRVVNYFVDTHTMSLSNGGQKCDTTIADLSRSNYITNLSVMYRRGVFGDLPDWLVNVPVPDYTYHMLHASKGAIHYIDRPMAVYRQSSKGVWSMAGEERRLWMSLRSRTDLIEHFSSMPEVVEGLVDASLSAALSLAVHYEMHGGDSAEVRKIIKGYRPQWSEWDIDAAVEERRAAISAGQRFTFRRLIKMCRAFVSYLLPRPRI